MLKRTLLIGVAALAMGFGIWLQAFNAPARAQEALAKKANASTPDDLRDELLQKMIFSRSKSLSAESKKGDTPITSSMIRVSPRGSSGDDAWKDRGPDPGEEPEPEPPEEPGEDPLWEDDKRPTFFGEPVEGCFVFVLDRSYSMNFNDSWELPVEDSNGSVITNPSRMAVVKAEAIKVVSQLREDDEFAIVTFGGGSQGEWTWYPERVRATPGNISTAIDEISNMIPSGGTPAYTALKKACTLYNAPPGLDKIYFLCDGAPNTDSGGPGGSGAAMHIISAFPEWWTSGPAQSDCSLICVHFGNGENAGLFMWTLANLVGGTYVNR